MQGEQAILHLPSDVEHCGVTIASAEHVKLSINSGRDNYFHQQVSVVSVVM